MSYKHLHQISINEEYTKSYEIRYLAEIQHLGLSTYRVLKDKDRWILENKIDAQFKKWDDLYSNVKSKDAVYIEKASNQSLAETLTLDAKEKISEIENILHHTLDIDDTVDWSILKDKKDYIVSNPMDNLSDSLNQIVQPSKPIFKDIPPNPDPTFYVPKFTIIDKLIKSRATKKQLQAESYYEDAINSRNKIAKENEEYNDLLKKEFEFQQIEYNKKKEDIYLQYNNLEKDWEKERDIYYKRQDQFNLKIDILQEDYLEANPNAISQYCEIVLNNSEYPEFFQKNFEIEYNHDNRLLIVEYILPEPELFPRISEVKYIATKKEIKKNYFTESQLTKMYDTAIYSISLRTIHELFEADSIDAIDLIVFNGWVDTINKATGKRMHNCIMSVQVRKSEFIQIDLANVDPKSCFKSLKGVASSKLSSITAIQPLVQLNKIDKRFVSSYEVANKLEEGENLALMDWEDFEHLIRELFEKEFSSNGGEVKVTQASRDGGVDAVAFDPDPIRGGKIVIQAKRYTNTVGVSAVRDLYGTVMNEGATKGILVSTADYGPDAYEFAKNKPITLLNGSNLLFLLEKHGQKARIDLAEAKRIQSGTS